MTCLVRCGGRRMNPNVPDFHYKDLLHDLVDYMVARER